MCVGERVCARTCVWCWCVCGWPVQAPRTGGGVGLGGVIIGRFHDPSQVCSAYIALPSSCVSGCMACASHLVVGISPLGGTNNTLHSLFSHLCPVPGLRTQHQAPLTHTHTHTTFPLCSGGPYAGQLRHHSPGHWQPVVAKRRPLHCQLQDRCARLLSLCQHALILFLSPAVGTQHLQLQHRCVQGYGLQGRHAAAALAHPSTNPRS